jgi:hypothetical protein
MNFEVMGPYTLKRFGEKHKIITDQTRTNLKVLLDDNENGLSSARGCYVFAIHAGQGYTPYYVGQAAKQSLLRESLSHGKQAIYNKVCSNTNGTPVLFFVPATTRSGKYRATNTKLPSITFLEQWLIAKALEKNPELHNTKETKFLRKLHVTGIFNATQGEATKSSGELAKALSL